LTFIYNSANLHYFILLVSVKSAIISNILDSIFSEIKYGLELHLVEMDTDLEK
jgi:hypothetical protein